MKPPVEAPTSTQSRPDDVDVECVERVLQLLATARDEARWALDLELGVVRDLLTRLVVPRDESGEHERLRLRARLGEPALDEEHVEALPLRHAAPRKAFCADQGLSATSVTIAARRHPRALGGRRGGLMPSGGVVVTRDE